MSAPGCFSSIDSASSAVRKSPSTNAPGVVDEEAAVGVAVPGDPEVGALLAHLVDDEAAVLLQQRVRLVVGEVAVGRPVGRHEVEAELLEQRPDHRPGHAVAAVDDDLQRLDRGGVDELQRRLAGTPRRRRPPRTSRRRARLAEAGLDQVADVPDPAVARQRDRAALDELGARVGLRVVRGGAHQPAVELARADEEIEHLGADHPGVEHVRALGDHPVAVAARPARARAGACRGRGRRAGRPRLAGHAGEHARERAADLLGDVAVDLARRRGRGCRRP